MHLLFRAHGIGEAVFATLWSVYGWADAFLYVIDRCEATGYQPRGAVGRERGSALANLIEPLAIRIICEREG